MRHWFCVAMLLAAALAASCSDDSSGPRDEPPGVVADLRAEAPNSDGVLLTWTAPGDDGATGRAAAYEIRWLTHRFADGEWETAQPFEGEPVPRAAGEPESLRFHGVTRGLHYYFMIRSIDEEGNASPLSDQTGVLIRYPERTDAEGLVECLKIAYNDLNLPEMEKLFDPSFEFVFAPWDVGVDGIPERWGCDEELGATRHIFTQQVNREQYRPWQIVLQFETEEPDTIDGSPDTVRIGVRMVDLSIDCRHATTNRWLIYVCQGDRARFHCVETETDAWPGGPKLWTIVRWEDIPHPGLAPATERTTWGAIKWKWR